MIPLRSNIQPTEPTSPRFPLNFVKVCRISGAVRVARVHALKECLEREPEW